MIHELKWDSSLFHRKMGELRGDPEPLSRLETALEKAREEGFQYLRYRLHSHETVQAMQLASLGFYLSDICVTWAFSTEKFSHKFSGEDRAVTREATRNDIPTLKKMVKSLFLESVFYNDPFFSNKDADILHEAWIENSVKGEVADRVIYIPEKGFVTCKKLSSSEGRIVLIGVRKDCRGKALGSILIQEAVKWFQKLGIKLVLVRTQLKNLNAMNFYKNSGFYIKDYDVVYAKIITQETK